MQYPTPSVLKVEAGPPAEERGINPWGLTEVWVRCQCTLGSGLYMYTFGWSECCDVHRKKVKYISGVAREGHTICQWGCPKFEPTTPDLCACELCYIARLPREQSMQQIFIRCQWKSEECSRNVSGSFTLGANWSSLLQSCSKICMVLCTTSFPIDTQYLVASYAPG